MIRRLSAACGLVLLGVCSVWGQDDRELEWRERVDWLLDRWSNPDEVEDRVERAVDHLVLQLNQDPDQGEIALQLARLHLAQGAYGAAQTAAVSAAEQLGSLRKPEALALSYLAAHFSMQESLRDAAGETESRRLIEEGAVELERRRERVQTALLIKLHQELPEGESLEEGAGRAAFGALVNQELERRRYLQALNGLGRAPEALEQRDLEGQRVDWGRYAGQVVLVLFWSENPEQVDCAETVAEAERVREAYAERGFQVVGVGLDGDVERFAERAAGLGWRHVRCERGLASPDVRTWGVQSLPAGFLIDHEGRIRYVDPWVGDGSLEGAVRSALDRRDQARLEESGRGG